jgi:hypothetical protein
MEIPDDAVSTVLEQLQQIQLGLRSLRVEIGKWKQDSLDKAASPEGNGSQPPTEKQIRFLKGLGVQEMPATKVEARRLLQEINQKLELGEYSIPPTEKQLKFLKDLNYAGKTPESREEAWNILRELRGIE